MTRWAARLYNAFGLLANAKKAVKSGEMLFFGADNSHANKQSLQSFLF
jgi:hypothetical protein